MSSSRSPWDSSKIQLSCYSSSLRTQYSAIRSCRSKSSKKCKIYRIKILRSVHWNRKMKVSNIIGAAIKSDNKILLMAIRNLHSKTRCCSRSCQYCSRANHTQLKSTWNYSSKSIWRTAVILSKGLKTLTEGRRRWRRTACRLRESCKSLGGSRSRLSRRN